MIKKPTRFVGLHSHSGFSTFDGLDYPNEHIDFCRENGLDAFALTDHGHMNGFAHAYLHTKKLNDAGANFKFIPGCEMYVHPDLDVWSLDHQIQKAAKQGDQAAINKLNAQREKIITPLFDRTDSDDELEDIEIINDTNQLTIENEEETKSGKFYDPVKRRHHLVVLPKTNNGIQKVMHLVSRGYLEGFFRFPRIDYKMLREAGKDGDLIISSACLGGPFAYEIFKHMQQVEFDHLHPNLLDRPGMQERVLNDMGNVLDQLSWAVGLENVFLELQFNKLSAQHLVNKALLLFAKKHNLQNQLVVTCDSHYSRPDHWKERELYKKLGWLNYKDFNPENMPSSKEDLKCELYPKNSKQVWDSYIETTQEYPGIYDDTIVCDAIERTYDIAHDVIDHDMSVDTSMKLPSYVIPENMSPDKALLEACKKGLVARGKHTDQSYIDRLKMELTVIREKGFSAYFLTMKKMLDIARREMFVGPGRGSGAGSLVAWTLNITDMDPIEYGLLFERFLSIHRKGYPDIDTDVGDRDRLIQMLRDEFSAENVIPISNYNTFKLKTLVKDISRFYGIPFEESNNALKTVENDVISAIRGPGFNRGTFVLEYKDALEHSDKFREFIEKYPMIAEPINVLFKQNKALGRHAGGVIVSENIAERMPLIRAKGEAQTPWTEGMTSQLEKFGWIKFDLLGLGTLRIIQDCIKMILREKSGKFDPSFKEIQDWYNKNLAPDTIDHNDQEVYKNVYHDGNFVSTFQCVNAGAQRLFMKCKPTSIVDLATLTSIYRPGPLQAHVDKLYHKQKSNPDIIDYKHPLIKECLEETAGCIIFQEQVMNLCHVVAGFPKEDCDMIRRKLMKRKIGEMGGPDPEVKIAFVKGAVNNGVPEKVADKLFEDILYFAGYGFNKSHAVAYAMISYQCAYLLTHFQEHWVKAVLNSTANDPKAQAKAITEIKSLGYGLVPIDINLAEKNWTIVDGKKLMPSFYSCKGIGETALDEIIDMRPYKSFKDMFWDEDGKWKLKKFNKRAVDSLLKIKAFDSFDEIGDGKLFCSYQHAYDVIINNWNDLRKSLKKEPDYGQRVFHEKIEELHGTPEWTKLEFCTNKMNLIGAFNVNDIISDEILNKIQTRGIKPINEMEPNSKGLCWFVILKSTVRLTKNKKKYLSLQVVGNDGSEYRMFLWGWNGVPIEPYTFCGAEVSHNSFGYSTKQKVLKTL